MHTTVDISQTVKFNDAGYYGRLNRHSEKGDIKSR